MSAVNSAADAASNSVSATKDESNNKTNGNAESTTPSADANGTKGEEDEAHGVKDEDGFLDDDLLGDELLEDELLEDDPPESPTNGSKPIPSEKQHMPAPTETADAESKDPTARLDAMQEERNSLRNEVAELRKSLESIQTKHDEEVSNVKEELEECQQGKDHAEDQYSKLLAKVNTIRSQLGERLKADAEELEQARGKIEDLESEKTTQSEENERLQEEMSKLKAEAEEQTTEIDNLRSRTNLSTTNWAKERDDMVSREAYLKEEYEVARQAMQDWEILATEERSRRETVEERVTDIEEQLGGSREAFERVKDEAETQSTTVEGLQRALRDLQEERKRELRELVEQSEAELEQMRAQTTEAETSSADVKKELEASQTELERALPFEKEVREKNLLIGKLRHEAVILNDHLTKALRFLKRGKPEDNVDRQLVTNHLLHFLALDRSDAKKFQVLQLIAALLGWDDQQKEQAGLVRTGTGSLKLPLSPFRRTPSTPGLSTFIPESPSGKESLAELWSDFLERETEATGGIGGSRRPSASVKNMRSPSMTSPPALGSPLAPSKDPFANLAGAEIKRSETQSPGTSSTKGGGLR